jgi:carbon storage regulator
MLVLSRKPGETVVIGGNIEVTVLEVHGDRVKLGLCGPTEVPIRREEVHRRVARDKCSCPVACR